MYVYIFLSFRLFVHIYVCVTVHHSVFQSTWPFLCLFISLSGCLSFCLFYICPSVLSSVHQYVFFAFSFGIFTQTASNVKAKCKTVCLKWNICLIIMFLKRSWYFSKTLSSLRFNRKTLGHRDRSIYYDLYALGASFLPWVSVSSFQGATTFGTVTFCSVTLCTIKLDGECRDYVRYAECRGTPFLAFKDCFMLIRFFVQKWRNFFIKLTEKNCANLLKFQRIFLSSAITNFNFWIACSLPINLE